MNRRVPGKRRSEWSKLSGRCRLGCVFLQPNMITATCWARAQPTELRRLGPGPIEGGTVTQNHKNSGINKTGFTLIEVLLALTIIAIAFTALLKATGENITNTRRLSEKTIAHWVAMQGITMIQLGLINPPANVTTTKVTNMFGQKIFWRINLATTRFMQVQQITITVSQKQAGPFTNPLIGYRYANA